jgi:hypothetical protein
MSVIQKVRNYLSGIRIPNRSVIIFDIDDTLIQSSNGKGIADVLQSYYLVNSMGIKPIIITARLYNPYVVNYTYNQLASFGINNPTVFFCPEGMSDYGRYKLMTRKSIADRGFNIIMSIGDQPWDIGEYGGYGIIVKRRN